MRSGNNVKWEYTHSTEGLQFTWTICSPFGPRRTMPATSSCARTATEMKVPAQPAREATVWMSLRALRLSTRWSATQQLQAAPRHHHPHHHHHPRRRHRHRHPRRSPPHPQRSPPPPLQAPLRSLRAPPPPRAAGSTASNMINPKLCVLLTHCSCQVMMHVGASGQSRASGASLSAKEPIASALD